MDESIITELAPSGIASITLNRSERHNAFDDVMIQSLTQKLVACEAHANIKIILLKANGENFSAGADLHWMRKMLHFTEQENLADALQLARLLQILYQSKKVTIALTQGMAMGGGVGLLACCDMVVASQEARFCFSEAKLGLVPATIAPYVIQAVGQRMAKYYFLTAKTFSAKQAKQIGLIHDIVSHDTLFTAGMTLAHTLLKNGPSALARIKQLVANLAPFTTDYLKETASLIAAVRTSPEAQEGINAFLEKRKPAWASRSFINFLKKNGTG